MKTQGFIGTTQNDHARVFTVAGDWQLQAEKLKEKFPQLTDEDLKLKDGERRISLEGCKAG